MKYVKVPVNVDEEFILEHGAQNNDDSDDWLLMVNVHRNDDHLLREDYREAVQEVALAINAHDALVDACKDALVDLRSFESKDNDLLLTIHIVEAALALAKGGTSE